MIERAWYKHYFSKFSLLSYFVNLKEFLLKLNTKFIVNLRSV